MSLPLAQCCCTVPSSSSSSSSLSSSSSSSSSTCARAVFVQTGCYLEWGVLGDGNVDFCGVQIFQGTTLLSEAVTGIIYNPPSGTYTAEVCCNGIWYTSATINFVNPGTCGGCSCALFPGQTIKSISLNLPGDFSVVNGTYMFTTPACTPNQDFPLAYNGAFPPPGPVGFPPTCNWSTIDTWAAGLPGNISCQWTSVVSGDTIEFRHYLFPRRVRITFTGLGNIDTTNPVVGGQVEFYGYTMTKNVTSGTCAVSTQNLNIRFVSIGTTLCRLAWTRYYQMDITTTSCPAWSAMHLSSIYLAQLTANT